jgi:hypothetical protein
MEQDMVTCTERVIAYQDIDVSYPAWLTRNINGCNITVIQHYRLVHKQQHVPDYLFGFERRKNSTGQWEYFSEHFVLGMRYEDIKMLVDICEEYGLEFDIMPEPELGPAVRIRWRQKE